jgi:transcriptional regulator with XRE-family HTH domain
MPTNERAADRGRRRCRVQIAVVATDGRIARITSGLSQSDVATSIGCSHARVGRFERGETRQPDLEFMSAYCSVLGLDLVLRAYPGGDALRDRAQVALLERLRTRLGPGLRWRIEVPLPGDRDLRAWDATISGTNWRCRVEAETRIADAQAVARRIALKARDDPGGHVLVLVSATRVNRSALRAARDGLRDFLPLDTREMLTALSQGREPFGNGIVML